jgi:hypothetical protein
LSRVGLRVDSKAWALPSGLSDNVVRVVAGIFRSCGARCSRVPVRRRPDGRQLAGTNRLRVVAVFPNDVVVVDQDGQSSMKAPPAGTIRPAQARRPELRNGFADTMSRAAASKARKYGKARCALKAGRSA